MSKPLNLCGPSVRRRRNALKLTQDELAAQCQIAGWQISREAIAKIESRLRTVTDCELVTLCRVLRMPAHHLIPGLPAE